MLFYLFATFTLSLLRSSEGFLATREAVSSQNPLRDIGSLSSKSFILSHQGQKDAENIPHVLDKEYSDSRNHPFCSGNLINMDRRSAMEVSGKALVSLLLSSSVNPTLSAQATERMVPIYDSKLRTIVMTGCNSGIGFDAAKRMAEKGHTIIMACRTLEKATDAATRIKDELQQQTINLIPKECDLADLKSIQSFAKDLNDNTTIGSIDTLCLNAGLSRNTSAKDVLRTKQGFELTIGTNHLGHFYLTQLLLPLLEKKDEGGNTSSRIVVTASGVHDPDSPGGAQGSKATLGTLSGLEKAVRDGIPFDMIDGEEFDADKAYKDSKLCNVLFTRELKRRLMKGNKDIDVNCFNPGLIVSTGLFRDQNPLFTKVFDFAATDLFKVGETVHWGGGALEYMTLDKTVNSKSGLYYTSPPGSSKYGDSAFGTDFIQTEVSIEARDDVKAQRLWELSEKLVGISA